MSEDRDSKTEQPTGKKLQEAFSHGQFARSAEIQSVFVLAMGLLALTLLGPSVWRRLVLAMTGILGHLHTITLQADQLQRYLALAAAFLSSCVAPIVLAVMFSGLLAGALQSRFRATPNALEPNWARLNPVGGLKRIFTLRSAIPGLLGCVRLGAVLLLSYTAIRRVLEDPIFFTSVGVARIAEFLAGSTAKILLRIVGVMALLAALDYAYQLWRTHRDLMMTREEVKEESKSSEGNPQVKGKQRQMRSRYSFRKSLLNVPKADVVVTNPTHLAVALRYDRRRMKAPRVVAKGSRLNALRIRSLAHQFRVPIVENKPLARLLFKYGRVDGEIPAELYVAVAEVLAWVYRVNRYRYYAESNQVDHADPASPAHRLAREPDPLHA